MSRSRRTVFYSFLFVGFFLSKLFPIKIGEFGIFILFCAFMIPYLKWMRVIGFLYLKFLITLIVEEWGFLLAIQSYFNELDYPEMFSLMIGLIVIIPIYALMIVYLDLRKKRAFERIGSLQ